MGASMSTDFSWDASTAGSVRPVKAPTWPIWMAVATAVASVLLLLPASSSSALAIAGYCAGAVLTPAFTVIFRFGKQSATQNPFYIPQRSAERLLQVALVVGILAGVGHAWLVATELAKQ